MSTVTEAYDRKLRLSRALYAIHRPSKYYWGITPEGEAHLLAGGTIGGPDGMPMDVGMNQTKCCSTCHHRELAGVDEWPCATVKLLLEADVVSTDGETRVNLDMGWDEDW